MPHLRELVKLHQDKPFAIVGVNTGDAPDVYKKGLEEHGVTWISAYQDRTAPIAELYQVQAFPTYFLLDREGRIAAKGHSAEEITAEIPRLLAE